MANLLGELASKINGGSTSVDGQDAVKLLVAGKAYEGWQTISIKRSIKAIAGAFDLTVIDKWAEEQTAWAITPGDECSVLIGTDTMITGYVDKVSPRFDANSRSISISGRDKSGDMVDCSIDQKPGAWTNISLLTLAKRLATPFKVGVKLDDGVDQGSLFPAWKIQQSESAFESLDRAAKLKGLLLTNDGKGNIVITRAGKLRSDTQIVQGENILDAQADYDMKERHSIYVVKSQTGGLDDGADPDVDFACQGTATDPLVKRFRPMMIIAEGAATAAVCRQRARWEASVRVGRSSKVSLSVPGWRQNSGQLWTPNQVVKVNAPWLGINLELLITDVTFSKSDSGTKTQLSLEPVQAYEPDPTLITRKEPLRQLVIQESARK